MSADINGAQHLRARADDRTIVHGGMALDVVKRGSTQCYLVIQGHIITDFRGFSNHYALAMVDEKAAANACGGMNLNAGEGTGRLGE